jgi:Tfp pilus assembly protein PilO
MIASASPHQRMMIGTVLVGLALLAALWVLALSPKRTESATVRTNVATQEQRLTAAQLELAGYEKSRDQYPGLLAELRTLDEAVPARAAIPDLLRQLQRRARVRSSELQIAALKPGATSPSSAIAPGATAAAGGLAALPFTFTYAGKYFDLVHVLAAARKAVTVKSGDLAIDGRLVTIEGVSFAREDPTAPIIKASVSGTAYIAAAPVAPPTTPAATPAATASQGGA